MDGVLGYLVVAAFAACAATSDLSQAHRPIGYALRITLLDHHSYSGSAGHTITKGWQIANSDYPQLYCDHPQSLKLKMASKRRNMFCKNKKQETTKIGSVEVKYRPAVDRTGTVLNSEHLNVTAVEECQSFPVRRRIQFVEDDGRGLLNISFGDLGFPEHPCLRIHFEGKIENNMIGFYRTSYMEGNDTRLMWLTNLKPNYARRVFPCYDQPFYRVLVQVDIKAPPGYSVIQTPLKNDHRRYPLDMISWVVFENGSMTSLGKDGIRVWSRRGVEDQARRALHEAARLLKAEVPLPPRLLPANMQLVALPDFMPLQPVILSSNVTFIREGDILFDDGKSTSLDWERLVMALGEVIGGHVLGPPHLPNASWIVDGLVRFLQYGIVSQVHPELMVHERLPFEELQAGLYHDGPNATPLAALQPPILPSSRLLSFSKGHALLRMLNFATNNRFFNNISQLIEASQEDGITDTGLWDYANPLKRGSARTPPLQELMRNWIEHPGYPVINIDRVNNTLIIRQTSNYERDEPGMWWVPLTYTWTNFFDTNVRYWLRPNGTFRIKLRNNQNWGLFNMERAGFYRVNYDGDTWDALAKAVREGELVDFIKGQLVDDALSLALNGYIPHDVAFTLLDTMEGEVEAIPWVSALNSLPDGQRHPGGNPTWPGYILSLMEKVLSLDEDSEDTYRFTPEPLRIRLWKYACELGHGECLKRAAEINPRSSINKRSVARSPAMKSAFLCSAIRYGNRSQWDAVYERYKKCQVPSETDLLIDALSCSTNSGTLQEYLDLTLTQESGIRKQDFTTVLAQMSDRPQGANEIARFLQENFDNAINYIPENGQNLIDRVFPKLMRAIDEEHLKEMENFMTSVYVPDELEHLVQRQVNAMNEETKRRGEPELDTLLQEWKLQATQAPATSPPSPHPTSQPQEPGVTASENADMGTSSLSTTLELQTTAATSGITGSSSSPTTSQQSATSEGVTPFDSDTSGTTHIHTTSSPSSANTIIQDSSSTMSASPMPQQSTTVPSTTTVELQTTVYTESGLTSIPHFNSTTTTSPIPQQSSTVPSRPTTFIPDTSGTTVDSQTTVSTESDLPSNSTTTTSSLPEQPITVPSKPTTSHTDTTSSALELQTTVSPKPEITSIPYTDSTISTPSMQEQSTTVPTGSILPIANTTGTTVEAPTVTPTSGITTELDSNSTKPSSPKQEQSTTVPTGPILPIANTTGTTVEAQTVTPTSGVTTVLDSNSTSPSSPMQEQSTSIPNTTVSSVGTQTVFPTTTGLTPIPNKNSTTLTSSMPEKSTTTLSSSVPPTSFPTTATTTASPSSGLITVSVPTEFVSVVLIFVTGKWLYAVVGY